MTHATTVSSISPVPRSASRGSATCCCRTSARHVPTAYHRPEGRAVPRNYSGGRTVVSLAADRGARVNALRSCYPLSDFLLGAGLIYTDEKLRP